MRRSLQRVGASGAAVAGVLYGLTVQLRPELGFALILPLFAAAAPAPPPAPGTPALDRLDTLSPDEMTPREALEALYELKALREG